MLRALIAELSDPGRYGRAKAYARDGAVIDIDVREGVIAGQVFGSRSDPYDVTIYADGLADDELAEAAAAPVPTLLIPEPVELEVVCSCPDADNDVVCKHALAVMLVFADEVSVEPGLLSRWRTVGDDRPGTDFRPRRRRRQLVVPMRRPMPPRPKVDVLAPYVHSPQPLGELPDFSSLPRPRLVTPFAVADDTSRLVDEVLSEAIDVIVTQRRST
jgi:SWIM zinc finger